MLNAFVPPTIIKPSINAFHQLFLVLIRQHSVQNSFLQNKFYPDAVHHSPVVVVFFGNNREQFILWSVCSVSFFAVVRDTKYFQINFIFPLILLFFCESLNGYLWPEVEQHKN